MKQHEYKIVFITGQTELVYAFNAQAAKILARAEQIKKGNDYIIQSIDNLG